MVLEFYFPCMLTRPHIIGMVGLCCSEEYNAATWFKESQEGIQVIEIPEDGWYKITD